MLGSVQSSRLLATPGPGTIVSNSITHHHINKMVTGCVSSSLIMTITFLPPGFIFLSRTLFLVVLLPCSTFWTLQSLLLPTGLILPSWIFFVVPLAAQLIFAMVRNYFTSFTVERDAAAQGAIMVPGVQGSSISILRKISDTFKNGYPGLFSFQIL